MRAERLLLATDGQLLARQEAERRGEEASRGADCERVPPTNPDAPPTRPRCRPSVQQAASSHHCFPGPYKTLPAFAPVCLS